MQILNRINNHLRTFAARKAEKFSTRKSKKEAAALFSYADRLPFNLFTLISFNRLHLIAVTLFLLIQL